MVSRIVNLTLRVWEFIWTILVMALIGNIIAQAFAGNPASVNYIMFVSAFSMVSLFYLFPASWSETLRGHPIIMFIVDMLNAIFFLVGGIVLAARLEAHSCSNDHYTLTNNITNGTHKHREKRCREAQATTAFLWFAWACYTASMILSFIDVWSGGPNLRPRTSARRRPAMSQV
ncbi:hypothetical protein VTN00DRAFT_9582 [Thermoascus crustaceus]|uniref:uncharacterized protein n=1 Tax=Thermoascus crustaceus TaxID=5088 RepID=UPI003742F0AB